MKALADDKTRIARNAAVGAAALGIALAMNPGSAFAATEQNADVLDELETDAVEMEAEEASAPATTVQEASDDLDEAQAQADAAAEAEAEAAEAVQEAETNVDEAYNEYEAAQEAADSADATASAEFEAAVDDTQAAVEEQQDAVVEAETNYEAAEAEVTERQAELDEAQDQERQAKESLDAAEEAGGADAQPEDIEQAVTDAQEARDTMDEAERAEAEATAQADADEESAQQARENYDAAATNHDALQDAADSASQHLADAEAARERDYDAYREAEDAYHAAEEQDKQATSDLEATNEELSSAASGLANTDQATLETAREYKEISSELERAKAEYERCKAAYDEAQASSDAAAQNLAALERTLSKAEQDLANAQAAYDRAAAANYQAQNGSNVDMAALDKAVRDAQAVYNVAATQKNAAEAKLAAAEAAYQRASNELEQAKAAYRQLNNSYEFFEYIGDTKSMELFKTAKYRNYTHLTDASSRDEMGDATSYRNLRNTIQYLRYCNQLRVQNGLPELKVSTTLMAMAELNVNYEAVHYGHACQFAANENLATCSRQYLDTHPTYPYAGWYDREKAYYEAHIDEYPGARGLPLGQLMKVLPKSEFINVTIDGKSFYAPKDGGFYENVGHYLLIIEPNQKYTGFALTYQESNDRLTFSQTFSTNPEGGKTYTVDEFEKLIDEAFGKTWRTGAQQNAVVQATEKKNAASKEIQERKWEVSLANEAFEKAQNKLNSAKEAQANAVQARNNATAAAQDLSRASTQLSQAQATYRTVSAQRDAAVAQSDRAATAATQAKQELDDATATFTEAQQAYDEATQTLGAADNATMGAYERYSDAYSAYQQALANKAETQANKDAAQNAMNDAYQQWQESIEAARDAETAYAEATDRLAEAKNELTMREDALAEAEAQAQASREIADAATAEADAARAAYNEAAMKANALINWDETASNYAQAQARTQAAQQAYDEAAQAVTYWKAEVESRTAQLASLQDRLNRAQNLEYLGTATAPIEDPDFAYLNDYVEAARAAHARADQAGLDLNVALHLLDTAHCAYREAHESYISALADLAVAQDTYNRFAAMYRLNTQPQHGTQAPVVNTRQDVAPLQQPAGTGQTHEAHYAEASQETRHAEPVQQANYPVSETAAETFDASMPNTPAYPKKAEAKASAKDPKTPKTLKISGTTTPASADTTTEDTIPPQVPAGAVLGALGAVGLAAAVRTRRNGDASAVA